MTLPRKNAARLWILAPVLAGAVLAGCTLPASAGPAAPTAIPAPAVLPAPPAPPPTPAPGLLTGADLADVSTAEQIKLVSVPARDLAALRLRLEPELGSIPTPPVDPPAYEIGDRIDFSVHDSDTADNRTVTAELVHRTDVAYAWVEVGRPHDAAAIRDSIDTFSTRIYPAAVTTFGREASPGADGDPRLHVLHTTGMGNVAGYFLGSDQVSRLALPWSNEKEMFYISLEWMATLPSQEVYETVLAHEFQHMIHAAHDRNEEVWLNEGLSEYAQEAAGYPPDFFFASAYLANTDIQLNTWLGAGGSNGPHYGAAYLFVRYLVQQFGHPIARELVAESANGVEAVRRVLARQEGSPTFEQVYADWLVALALDQPDALESAGRYGFTELDFPSVYPAAVLDNLPTEYADAVGNFALDLIELDARGDFTIRFTGDGASRIAPTAPVEGDKAWWANRSDDSDARLTRLFDLSSITPGQPVTMTAAMWWDIEPEYDFGYVMASADGVEWDILPGTRTTPPNPVTNSFGEAYTGLSLARDGGATEAAWVTESFDLGAYAGGPLYLRFEYVTDDAVNHAGWFVDNLRIDAIGYREGFEGDAPGWQSEGWLLTDGRLDQRWLVQLITLERGALSSVEQVVLEAGGEANFAAPGLGRSRRALVTVSGLTEGTTEPAAYRLAIETQE